jgi:predicted DCC family thiol-disulfide oxidoreductase YuxK
MASDSPAAATVLFDGDCGFCRWSLDKLLIWDRRRRLRPLEIQSAEGQELLERAGVPMSARLESWHLVLPSGAVRSAGAGAAPLAELLPGGRPLAALFRRFPAPTERAYRWVAANRDRVARLLRIDASCDVRGAPPAR